MNRIIEYGGQRATECALGLGGCLAGAWLGSAVPAALTWVLLETGGADLAEGRFGSVVVLQGESPWFLHAAREFGTIVVHISGFLVAAFVAWRLKGVLALAATCIAFALVAPVCLELFRYGWSQRSTVEGLVQSLGVPQGSQPVRQAVAAVAMVGIVLLLQVALRRTGMVPLSAFAAPACLLYLFAGETQVGTRILDPAWIAYAPMFLAVAAALSASPARQPWQAPSRGYAAALAVAGILAYTTQPPAPTSDRSVRWAEQSSKNWSVRFESEEFSLGRQGQWLTGAEERLEAYTGRLGLPGGGKPIEVQVAASERAMSSVAPNRGLADSFPFRERGGVVTMIVRDRLPEDPRVEPVLAMRRAWGDPGSDAMAFALARYAIGEFGGSSLGAAAARIACEETRYPAETVFAANGTFLSPLVRDAVGGAWVENAVAQHGPAVLEELYKRDLLESLAMCADCVPGCEMQFAAEIPRRPAPGYLKGISFSHEGRGEGGYGSLAAGRELERIRGIGANAIALVPYAFTRAPEETSIRFRTLETDARLGRSARRARELGLRVMLKPHLWAGRRFHGSIAFQTKHRFEEWFVNYRRWMLHHARLAEMHGIDILAIGNELAGLTVHEKEWRSLIRDVRRVFRGPVTYAAHWESELSSLGFWDELDYIGVNFYFPIAGDRMPPEPHSPEMAEASRVIGAVQAGFAKPVLFTEVGFPALATAAARPWEENGSPLDPDLQALCYRIWMERFARGPGASGMFWWKWPSHGRGSPFDPSHRPLAKPAMGVLRDWFGRR